MRILSVILLICWTCFLSACASYSQKAAQNLDKEHEKYASQECQEKLTSASTHQNIKNGQMILMPALAVLTGGTIMLPLLATNLTLGYQDNKNSSEIMFSCNGISKTDNEIIDDTMINGLIHVATGGLIKVPVSTSK